MQEGTNMKPLISVLIPVYKESKLLSAMLYKLISQDAQKEIFVIIDEPSEESIKISKSFKDDVRFILNNSRIGKAKALNEAVKLSSGDVLFFLDADIELPDDPKFLGKAIHEMRDTDILDIKKRVCRDSFLSKMTYYEYLGFNISAWLTAKFVKKSPAVNGAAFAIKRTIFKSLGGFRGVISEDLDLATRAFLNNHRFKYTGEIEVYNHVYSTWKNWAKQRKRWALGTALWAKEYCRELLKSTVKHPQIFIPGLFFLFPSLVLVMLSFLIPDLFIHKIFSIIFLFLSIKFSFILPVLMLTIIGADFLKNLIPTFLSFLIFAVLFFVFSKKLGFKFKFHEFFIYYFFFSLLILLIMIMGMICVFVFNKKLKVDWKV
ncbi:glycosyltransferase family 2 protein [archaeon]|nr:glycosyltransferase family 2 protein [archaeon]